MLQVLFWLALVEMLALKARHEARWKVLQLVALSTSFICSFRSLGNPLF